MNMNISGKDYTLEYTFEAAMNSKCIENTLAILSQSFMLSDSQEDSKSPKKEMQAMFSGLSIFPQMVIENFFAGLLENHDDEVHSIRDAKKLYKQFCIENPESELAEIFGLQAAITEQMSEDGFLKRIGLETILSGLTEEVINPKTPTDHKKSTVRKKTTAMKVTELPTEK